MAEKNYSPRDAAVLVLNQVKDLLKESELVKSEKYKTEMKKEPASPPKDPSKKLERDFNDYETKSGKSMSSNQERLKKQVSPSRNPKEEAENNNPKPGEMPKNVYKSENPDKDADAELGEKVEHDVEEHFKENKDAEKKEGHKLMTKSCPHCGNMHKSEEFSSLCNELNKIEGNFENLSKSEKHKKLADKVESGKEGLKEALHEAHKPKKVLKDLREMDKHGLSPAEIKAKMSKAEMDKHGLSPEEIKAKMKKAESKHDRCVEHVEENSPEVKNPHAVCVAEGVKPAKWSKEEPQNGGVFIPAKIVGSAKLSKFMERMHAKRKARAAQGPESQSQEAVGAPEMDKKYEGFKAVEESARESGASDPAAVAAAAGRKKYGKEAFQHAAAAGKKMGKK